MASKRQQHKSALANRAALDASRQNSPVKRLQSSGSSNYEQNIPEKTPEPRLRFPATSGSISSMSRGYLHTKSGGLPHSRPDSRVKLNSELSTDVHAII